MMGLGRVGSFLALPCYRLLTGISKGEGDLWDELNANFRLIKEMMAQVSRPLSMNAGQ